MTTDKIANVKIYPTEYISRIEILYNRIKDIHIFLSIRLNPNQVQIYRQSLLQDFIYAVQNYSVTEFEASREIPQDTIRLFLSVCQQSNRLANPRQTDISNITSNVLSPLTTHQLSTNSVPNPDPLNIFEPNSSITNQNTNQNTNQQTQLDQPLHEIFQQLLGILQPLTNLNPTNLNPTNLNPTNLNPTNLNPTNLNPTNLNPTNLNSIIGNVSRLIDGSNSQLNQTDNITPSLTPLRQTQYPYINRTSFINQDNQSIIQDETEPPLRFIVNDRNNREVFIHNNDEVIDTEATEVSSSPNIQPAPSHSVVLSINQRNPVSNDIIMNLSAHIYNIITTTAIRPPNFNNINRTGYRKIKNFIHNLTKVWLNQSEINSFIVELNRLQSSRIEVDTLDEIN
jgi:hypothetical protein